ncbi:MAG: phosphoglycerate mutase family protein [Mucilaginibacter sp.]
MKSLKRILLLALLFITCNTFAQTTIFVVRHAEKATTPGNDPALSTEGKARATELAKVLQSQKIAAIFTTAYERTSQTGEPALRRAGLHKLQIYNPADIASFAKQVLQDYAGKTVLVVGHSNTVVPTLQAFGAEKPFETLDDEDYDFLFKVTIGADKKVSLDAKQYGVAHHSTKPFPQNKMMQSN